jgi:hypothetical protein
MKRSEMIDALAGYLEEQYDLDTSLSAIVLDFLESKGMLPPAYKKTVLADNGFGFNNNFYVQTFVNKWEPEDDQH